MDRDEVLGSGDNEGQMWRPIASLSTQVPHWWQARDNGITKTRTTRHLSRSDTRQDEMT